MECAAVAKEVGFGVTKGVDPRELVVEVVCSMVRSVRDYEEVAGMLTGVDGEALV